MFGWTPDVVLQMPVRRFFAIVKSGRKLEAADKMEQCDVAAIAIGNDKYYDYLKGIYHNRILELNETEVMVGPEYKPLSDDDHKENRMNVSKIFAIKKRELGYGK